jgi:ketosteroid isomerase-like protein
MSSGENRALQTALAYFRAWTSHDFERAMRYVADDIVCQAPAGQLVGAEAFRGFMGPFAEIVTSSRLVAAFGDDETALLMYDTDTVPVNDAPGAECHTVRDGKIAHMRIIFDRLPFTEARRAAVEHQAAQDRRGDV